MTKNEDISKPFEVIERQILEVENVFEKNKDFTILFFSQLYTQLDTCQKFHPYKIMKQIDRIDEKKLFKPCKEVRTRGHSIRV